jgi:hypothetical protein
LYEIGFEVKKNEYNRFYIDTKKVDMLNETQEELFFLRHLKTKNASKIA